MDEYLIDKGSVVAEVKERNRFYRALIEVKRISGIALNFFLADRVGISNLLFG